MDKQNKSTPAATEVDQKLFYSVGIAGYKINQQRISENQTDNLTSTLKVEFLFISHNSNVEKFNRFLKDLNKFIDEQNQ
ncbi:hypothetical protein [Bacillus velezensis]|uniref:hypothetical protein n=1 Tax=Bacillus velezensis TaxID=492670 RepID=UPI00165B5BB8|nr:hypothetical protein [Bacillus velezensis]MEC2288729.1 hypothetical protein [Bacillus velezensis]MEC2423240.1 hypothetical protein [Bacillus velezensis]QNQ51852.1 hypothetical protein IAR44_08920 [Bacillus velezensis]